MVCQKLTLICERVRFKNSLHNTLFVTFITCLSAAYISVYPFTYLPEMIRWFGYLEVNKGYYAGFIASSYFIGNAIFAYFWGWLSDKKGRKPVLIIQLISTGVFCLVYGFCTTFNTAVMVRFFDGAANGVLTVGNAILYDSTDDSNQALALSLAATAWGLGVCLGPLISGYLASPVNKYPWSFIKDGFFSKYPYSLPSFVGFAVAFLSALVVIVFLPNDNRNDYEQFSNRDDDPILEENDKIESDNIGTLNEDRDSKYIVMQCNDSSNNENIVKVVVNREMSYEMENCTLNKVPPSNKSLYSKFCERAEKFVRNNRLLYLIMYREVLMAVIVYGMFTFSTIGFWEILPVWLSTSYSYGGLGLTSSKIGLVLGTVTIAGLILQSLIVVRFEKRFGTALTFIVFAIFLTVSMDLVPMCRLFRSGWSLWLTVFLCAISVATSMTACYAAISIIVNNSAPLNQVGAVNGLAQTVGSFIKALGPIVGGNLFTWSISSNIGPPVDSSIVFVFFGFIIWLSALIVYFLPRHLDYQTKVPKSPDNIDELPAENSRRSSVTRDQKDEEDSAFDNSKSLSCESSTDHAFQDEASYSGSFVTSQDSICVMAESKGRIIF